MSTGSGAAAPAAPPGKAEADTKEKIAELKKELSNLQTVYDSLDPGMQGPLKSTLQFFRTKITTLERSGLQQEETPHDGSPPFTCENPDHRVCNAPGCIGEHKIEPGLVAAIIKGFFHQGTGERRTMLQMDLRELTVSLVGFTQAGKTQEMLKIIWVLHFKFRVGAMLFLKSSDQSVYSDMQASVTDFNDKLEEWHRREFVDVEPPLFRGSKIADFQLVYSDTAKGIDDATLEDHKCPVYCRMSTAQNFRNAMKLEGPKLIKHYGFDPVTRKLNIRFVLDEDQLNVCSSTLRRTKKGYVLHHESFHDILGRHLWDGNGDWIVSVKASERNASGETVLRASTPEEQVRFALG